jgi:hypothetical protein
MTGEGTMADDTVLPERVTRLRNLSLIVLAYRARLPIPTKPQIDGFPSNYTLAQLWSMWVLQAERAAIPDPSAQRLPWTDIPPREPRAPVSGWRAIVPRAATVVRALWRRLTGRR